MSTPHNTADKGMFAKTVLMPGDPLRAKYIAEKYLENPKLVNNVRGIQGYTGTYKGKEVSVMASGMGMPSIGIYSYELFNEYDVQNIIRIGSAGSIKEGLEIKDIVFALGASTNSNYASQYELPGVFAPIASFDLVRLGVQIAEERNARYQVGNVLSSDIFYNDTDGDKKWRKMGVLAVEMEAAALYMNAARCGKNALTMLTVSDNILTGEGLAAEERQLGFDNMLEIALEIAARY